MVPCCVDCNGRLSDVMVPSIGDRAQRLRGLLRRRYEGDLLKGKWSEREIDNSGIKGRLREHIEAKQIEIELVECRLAHLSLVASLAPSMDDVWKWIAEGRVVVAEEPRG